MKTVLKINEFGEEEYVKVKETTSKTGFFIQVGTEDINSHIVVSSKEAEVIVELLKKLTYKS